MNSIDNNEELYKVLNTMNITEDIDKEKPEDKEDKEDKENKEDKEDKEDEEDDDDKKCIQQVHIHIIVVIIRNDVNKIN